MTNSSVAGEALEGEADGMRRSGLRVLVASACLAGAMAVPAPSMANSCGGGYLGGLVPRTWSIESVTIGAAGEPIATTPYIEVWACTDSDGGIIPSFTPRVETYDNGGGPEGFLVYLDAGDSDSATYESIIVGVRVDGTTEERIVTVPLPGGNGQDVCVAFVGPAHVNPGGCLLFVNR